MTKTLRDESWDENEPIESIADNILDYYAILPTFPAVIRERCWERVRGNPGDVAATKVLFEVLRAALGWENKLEDACSLKELLDRVAPAQPRKVSELGHALWTLLGGRLRRAMQAQGVTEEELRSNPMGSIECAFGQEKGDEESHLTAGLLMAGYRGMSSDVPAMRVYGFILSVREAYNFFCAKRPKLAELSLEWADRERSVVEKALQKGNSEAIGQMYAGTALAADVGGYHEYQLDLLAKAKAFLPKEGDEYADCLYREGAEYQRQGKLSEALQRFEEGLCVPNVSDLQLKGLLRASLTTLRAELEGNLSAIEMAKDEIEAFGHDPAFLDAWKGLMNALEEGRNVSDKEHLEAIRVTKALIAKWVAESQPAQWILTMYIMMIKFGLSLQDPGAIPFSLEAVLAEAEKYEKGAKDETVMEYRQLRALLNEAASPGCIP